MRIGILEVIACLCIVGSFFALAVAASRHDIPTALAGAALLFGGLIYLILAGIADAVQRAAFHGERAADLLERLVLTKASEPAPLPYKSSQQKARRFYIQEPDGVSVGPLDEAQVQQMLNNGRVTEETNAMREGEDEWKRLGSFFAAR
jgi:hypothetical protein